MFWCRIGDVKRREGVSCYVLRVRLRVRGGGGNYALGQQEAAKCDWGSREALRN